MDKKPVIKEYKIPEVKPKVEIKKIEKPKKRLKDVLSVNLNTEVITLNGVKQTPNKPPFKTFAGIFIPMSIIEKMFNVKKLKDGYEIERRF